MFTISLQAKMAAAVHKQLGQKMSNDKGTEDKGDFQWYLDRPEIKDVALNNKYLDMPKLRWNPFSYTFAIGLSGAVASLTYGLYCTMKDRRMMIQKMMEARVAFQTLAVISVVGGMFYFNREIEKIRKSREQ